MASKKALGMYDSFVRSGKETRSTHYCAGCGHGVLNKLIGEALVELGIREKTAFVGPVGCGVFEYYYLNTGHVSAAHGRASAVATGMARSLPDAVVISYQGDGDLGAIGFNNAFQAANRGERFATFFVNNAIYGMTGGQLAPTTLVGMKTETSPYGRRQWNEGAPLRVCEVFNTLEAPVYIERVSLSDPKNIMKAKKAVRKALEIQRDGKGYAFVEFLSPCPTNLGMDSVKAAEWVNEVMEKAFPLGCFRDRSEEAAPSHEALVEARPVSDYFRSDAVEATIGADAGAKELRIKLSGFGGQGILSLGLGIANAGLRAGRHATWFPSYGPEQRGGAASCSVVISGQEIGSPVVDEPDVLVCMNQPAFDRFASTVRPGGILLLEGIVKAPEGFRTDIKVVSLDALGIASAAGVPKAANTALLGALDALNALGGLPLQAIESALADSFKKKPALVAPNLAVFKAARERVESMGA